MNIKTLATILLCLAPSVSVACSCVKSEETELEDVRKTYENAKAVIYGEAVSSRSEKIQDPFYGLLNGEVTEFKVIRKFKGNIGERVETSIITDCCLCGVSFEVGKKYLLYLVQDENGIFSTSICMRPKVGDEAIKESEMLGNITANKSLKDVDALKRAPYSIVR